MRFPWLQLDADFIAHKARDVAALLGCSRVQAIGHMSLLWAWAVSRGTEDAPPTGLVTGIHAVRLIESAAEWTGTVGALFEALCDSDIGLLEKTPDGVRVRGLDRYAKTWEKQRKDRARKADVRATSDGIPVYGAGKTQKKTQSQKEATTLSSGDDGPDDLPDATEDAHPVTQPAEFATQTMANAISLFPEAEASKPEKPKGPDPEALRGLWNRLAPPKGLQRWEAMGDDRKRLARLSLAACPDLARWEAWLTYELGRPFNLGESGWRADVDWLLRAKTRNLVLDFNPATAPKPPASATPPKPVKFVEM